MIMMRSLVVFLAALEAAALLSIAVVRAQDLLILSDCLARRGLRQRSLLRGFVVLVQLRHQRRLRCRRNLF